MEQNPVNAQEATVYKEVSLEEILRAANLLPTDETNDERIATALRAIGW